MTSYTYPKMVALLIPATQAAPANLAAQQLTAFKTYNEEDELITVVRPEDAETFRDEPGRRFLKDDGTVYLLAGPTPMKQDHIEKLPMLAEAFSVDALWVVTHEWEDNVLTQVEDLDTWAQTNP